MYDLIGKKFDYGDNGDILVWYDCPRLFIQRFDNNYIFNDVYERETKHGWFWFHRILKIKNFYEIMNNGIYDMSKAYDLFNNSNEYIFTVSDGEKIINVIESSIENPFD